MSARIRNGVRQVVCDVDGCAQSIFAAETDTWTYEVGGWQMHLCPTHYCLSDEARIA